MSKHSHGLLDTSAVIDLFDIFDHKISQEKLPRLLAISTITLAELTAGPHATDDPIERAARQERLQWVENTFDPLSYNDTAARAYGKLFALTRAAGRKPRRRLADLLIASIAVANDVPLITRNPDDFTGLERLLTVVAI